MARFFYRAIALGFLAAAFASTVRAADSIDWQPWSPAAFDQAKREHKFVLLDLQAVWCHWCHVMDQETYADPRVIALIKSRYIAVRVDQDARPDLSNRYEDYGWPATVVFAADRSEIVKRQGYLPPRAMISMLQAIIADPSPGPSVTNAKDRSTGSAVPSGELEQRLFTAFDYQLGGWGTEHKFLDWDNTEYLMARALRGDAKAGAMARQILAGETKLIDPVWGGVYQYSITDWDHPHFEKLIQMQAENLRTFALAHATFSDPAYLTAARQIDRYVRNFLTSPDGTVYTSQNADVIDGQPGETYYRLDDAGRRRQGIPRIDTHVYARENGWWIEALCQLYAVTGDATYRDRAIRAAQWIVAHRSVAGGGFHHGVENNGPLYLGDTLAMGRAFLALAQATADPSWQAKSEQAASFIRDHFAVPAGGAGFNTAVPNDGDFPPQPEFDENVALSRWANLLAYDAKNPADRTMASAALKYLHDHASSRFAYVGGYLHARQESATDPLHVVIAGPRTDSTAQGLFAMAIATPVYAKQVEWIDPAETNQASSYPKLDKPAAYLCANQTCSAPVFDRESLLKLLTRAESGQR